MDSLDTLTICPHQTLLFINPLDGIKCSYQRLKNGT